MHELRKSLGERPRVEVRTYTMGKDGKLQEESCYPLEYYGSCPNVGDTLMLSIAEGSLYCYSVQRRYFVQESVLYSGWALILREIDPVGPPKAVWDEWQEATAFWGNVHEAEVAKLEKDRDEALAKHLEKSSLPKARSRGRPRKKKLTPRST